MDDAQREQARQRARSAGERAEAEHADAGLTTGRSQADGAGTE